MFSEGVVGGFSSIYGVLRILEERGEVRRGYFVDGLGPSQFCIVGAEERLRRDYEGESEWTILSAVDPANVYGAALPWPKVEGMRFERAANAYVIVHKGALIGFLSRGEQALNVLLSDDLPLAKKQSECLLLALRSILDSLYRPVIHLDRINGAPATEWHRVGWLKEFGAHVASSGVIIRSGPPAGFIHARR